MDRETLISILEDYRSELKSLRFFTGFFTTIANVPEEIFNQNKEGLRSVLSLLNDNKENLTDIFKEGLQMVDFVLNNDEVTAASSLSLDEIKKISKPAAMYKDMKIEKYSELLLKSSLMSLTICFETLISRIIEKQLYYYPGKLNNMKLSLDEIRELGSFEEAEKYLIEKQVQDVMRGNLNDWVKYIDELFGKVNLNLVTEDFREIDEIFCRRNVFVHNNGVVNSIYLTRVYEQFRSGVSKGDKLELTDDYLLKTIELMDKVGTLLTIEIWKRVEKDSMGRQQYIIDNLLQEYILTQQWNLLILISQALSNDKNISERNKVLCNLYFWLGMKKLGEFEKVRNDVMKADFSAMNSDLQLLLFALQVNKEKFFEILPQVNSKNITIQMLELHPFFDDVRQFDEYKEHIKALG